WDVCRVPDFRGISPTEHASLLTAIYGYLHEHGQVPTDWFARQVNRIDRIQGDIDTLSKRLAYIRTWTYVAQRKGWVADHAHWRQETRAVEDRLSDALHDALTQRFVDRRTSVLLRRLKQKESLVADVTDKGEVTIEGQLVGKLEGFRFRQDTSKSPEEAKTLRAAAVAVLAPHFHLQSDRMYNAADTEFDFTEQGGLMWGEHAVGKLVAGSEALKPRVQAFVDTEAGPEVAQKVERRLQHFIDRKIAALFEPLFKMQDDEALAGLAKGFAFRVVEALGILPRAEVADDVKALDQQMRGALRKHGIRFGQYTIFQHLLLKPAPTRLRLVLLSLAKGEQEFPEAPPPGLVTIPVPQGVADWVPTACGFRVAGERAIRIDMLERLADMIRAQDTRSGFEATPDMLSITGMTLDQFADLMSGLGYKAEKGERVKEAKPIVAPPSSEGTADTVAPEVTAQETPGVPEPSETPVEEPAPTPATPEVPEEAPPVEPPETPDAPPAEAPPVETPPEVPQAEGETAEAEQEVFYTFTWAPSRPARGPRREGGKGRPQGQGQGRGKPEGGKGSRKGAKGKGPRGKGGPRKDDGPRTYQAKPKREKPIDPDNPFAAALSGLKDQL
ncbi:MAG: disulfide oxidoreductase, partial [Shimia sp.]